MTRGAEPSAVRPTRPSSTARAVTGETTPEVTYAAGQVAAVLGPVNKVVS